MNTTTKSNNARLRELVDASGLSQAEALTLFNQALGPAPYSASAWKAFLASPETTRFRPFKDALLTHAEKVFEKLENNP